MAAVSDLRSAFVLMVCGVGTACAARRKICSKTSLHLCKSELLGFRLKASSSSLINVELWAAGGSVSEDIFVLWAYFLNDLALQ